MISNNFFSKNKKLYILVYIKYYTRKKRGDSLYHIQEFRKNYLVVNSDTMKAIASFNFLNDAMRLLEVIEDFEVEIEYLIEGKV